MEDYGWENEEEASCWEYWYMHGLYLDWQCRGCESGCSGAEQDSDWQEERELWRRMWLEKERGLSWVCPDCEVTSYVREPFRKLYCPDCLLEMYRADVSVLPDGMMKVGWWMLEDMP